MNTFARLYILILTGFCAAAFTAYGVVISEYKRLSLASVGEAAVWLDLSLSLVLPLAAPALIPAHWARTQAWARRLAAPYAVAAAVLCLGAFVESRHVPPQYQHYAPLALAAAAFALAGNLCAPLVLLWPDVRGMWRWFTRLRPGTVS